MRCTDSVLKPYTPSIIHLSVSAQFRYRASSLQHTIHAERRQDGFSKDSLGDECLCQLTMSLVKTPMRPTSRMAAIARRIMVMSNFPAEPFFPTKAKSVHVVFVRKSAVLAFTFFNSEVKAYMSNKRSANVSGMQHGIKCSRSGCRLRVVAGTGCRLGLQTGSHSTGCRLRLQQIEVQQR
ncbi:hypothetical protein AKJ16_DCAP15889 [Drosera capensis]